MDPIGQYQPFETLGEGVVGQVLAARMPHSRDRRALKVVHQHYRWDGALLAAIRDAWEWQQRCRHAHIVEVFEVVDESVLVMELIEGPSLTSLLESTGSLPVDVGVGLMCQVASAVGFAHGRGRLHGDLKPSNILISELETGFEAKVCDFGTARRLRGSLARKAVGSYRSGTLAYQSPEHFRAPAAVDERSDVYSLGAILYEMLAGNPPFEGKSEYSLVSSIVERPAPPPSELVGGACAEFDDLVLRALAKDPAKRFESCGELKEALRSRLSITRTHIHSMAAPSVRSLANEPADRERAAELIREARSRLAAGSLMAARGRARKALSLDADSEQARELILEIEDLERRQSERGTDDQLAEAVRLIQTFLRDRGPARARRILHQAVEALGNSPEFDRLGVEIDRADAALRRTEVGRLAARAVARDRRSRLDTVVGRVDHLIANRSLLMAAEQLTDAIGTEGRVTELDHLATMLAPKMVAQAEQFEQAGDERKGRVLRHLAADLAGASSARETLG